MRMKASFDHNVTPHSFTEGDLFILYDVAKEALGLGKFETLWKGLYIIKHCLLKGTYMLVEPDGTCLKDLINRLYVKKFIHNIKFFLMM